MSLSFDPERLRLAREDAGLRKKELADRIGISPAAVTQYESGRTSPRPSTLAGIALACGLPIEFFRVDGRPTRPSDVDQPFFRSLRSTRQWERVEAEAKATMVWRLLAEFERYIELPPVCFEDLSIAEDCREADIEDVACEVRRRWSIEPGPAPSVVQLLEANGAVVARVRPRSGRVDAFSQRVGGRPIVMLWSSKEDAARSRFDAAHELGHLVMHPDPEPGNQVLERQAHRFAAAFLMPADDVISELPTQVPKKADQRTLVEMKGHWGVSVGAILYRARELGTLSVDAHRQSMIRLSSWGWRTNEPGGQQVERPTLLRRSLDLVEQTGIADRATLAAALAVPEARIEEICGPGRPRVLQP